MGEISVLVSFLCEQPFSHARSHVTYYSKNVGYSHVKLTKIVVRLGVCLSHCM